MPKPHVEIPTTQNTICKAKRDRAWLYSMCENSQIAPMSRNHIIIIDGTQSRIETDHETNAGILYKLLKEAGDKSNRTLEYDPGVQGHGFWNWVTIASGWGINQSIRNAYDAISARYKDGDKIYLFGFSTMSIATRPYRLK